MKNLYFVLLTICLICISCTETGSRYPQIITPVLIAQDELYGNGEEGITKQNLVIKTQEEWDNLLNAMNSVNNVSDSFAETDIDFNSYIVIAVFDEVRGNSGCSINIAHIIEYIDSIVVDVHNVTATSGYDVMNQPFYIVKIPVTNKNIVFDYNVSNDTVPNDTIPIDTVPLHCSIWEWLPYPPCTDVTITLTFDSLTSMVYASTYPQYPGFGYKSPQCSQLYPHYYYLFNDGEHFIVSGDTLKKYNEIFDTYSNAFKISSTGYVCDTIDLISIQIWIDPPGIPVRDYTFIRNTD